MASTKNESRSGSVISTMMAALRCFDSEHRHLGVVEIADQTGLHKSSVSRLMTTLELERLVERDPATRRYSLGLGLLSVAGTLLADLDVRRTAYPVLLELAARTRESCSLLVWSEDQAVCVEQVPSPQTIKHTTSIGTLYRTTASSSVQALLAARPAAVVDHHGETVAAVLVAAPRYRVDEARLRSMVQECARAAGAVGAALGRGSQGLTAAVAQAT